MMAWKHVSLFELMLLRNLVFKVAFDIISRNKADMLEHNDWRLSYVNLKQRAKTWVNVFTESFTTLLNTHLIISR